MNILERARGFADRTLAQARGYRFEGEQANHADLLRERRVSLSMMEAADPADADQIRMASEIEHDAEARLTVLLGKPRLTLEEKRERDAIQAAIAGRRQGFGDAPPVLEARTEPTRLARFLGPLAVSPALAILASPITWIVVGIGAFGIQTARLENAKDDLREARIEAERMENSRDAYAAALGQERAARASDVAQVLEDTAATVEQMRLAQLRRQARERRERTRHEDLANGSVDFTERLRELAQPESERLPAISAPTPSGDPASAVPTGAGPNADDGANP
tara:strand:- start:4722 stop:5561 length:840 start_codon:yes stop_codon:yes gene_type:complete